MEVDYCLRKGPGLDKLYGSDGDVDGCFMVLMKDINNNLTAIFFHCHPMQ